MIIGSLAPRRSARGQNRRVLVSDWNGTFFAPDIPFGGYKRSGIGREMGVEGYLEYTEIKNVAATF